MNRATAFAIAFAALVAAPAAAGSLEVPLDRARTVRLNRDAAAVIVGNPAIADAAVHDTRMLILSGRSVGGTNLIVLDADGHTILEAELVVGDAASSRVILQRGLARNSHDCSSDCRPVPVLGDAPDAFNAYLEQRGKAIDAARGAGDSE